MRGDSLDPYRLVFDRLSAAGAPDAEARAAIYVQCRALIAAAYSDQATRDKALQTLEKVIRRQEMQAIYEESLNPRDDVAPPDERNAQ